MDKGYLDPEAIRGIKFEQGYQTHNTPEFDDRNIKGRYDMHDGAKVLEARALTAYLEKDK